LTGGEPEIFFRREFFEIFLLDIEFTRKWQLTVPAPDIRDIDGFKFFDRYPRDSYR
jgi:hypothetical protein